MNLSQRIDSDLKEAMRARDTTKLGVLRMLKSALKYAAIAKSGTQAELSDAEAAQVIRKQVKQRRTSTESFEKGGRAEAVEMKKTFNVQRLTSNAQFRRSVFEIGRSGFGVRRFLPFSC